MKTRDLIAALQAVDPTGDLECCADTCDLAGVYVRDVDADEGFLEILERDPAGRVVGAKIITHGRKVILDALPVEWAIFDNPRLPVDLETPAPECATRIDRWRQDALRAHEGVEAWRTQFRNEVICPERRP